MKTRKLFDGTEIPLIGLGTHNVLIEVDKVIYNAINEGVRLIDTGFRYHNEDLIGPGIEKAIKDGIVKREELIIIGKIWLSDRENPEKGLRRTLKNLHIDYIDLYLDHWAYGKDYRNYNVNDPFVPIPIYEFWPKMEALVEKGLVKSLGVSNYNVQCLCNLLSFCKIRPVVNEVEFNPYYYQKDLKDFCDKENIAIIGYSPLVHGIVARTYIQEHDGEFDIFEEQIIKDLEEKYNKTKGQIILNWHYCIGVIPIPATHQTSNRMEENLGALDFKMDDEDVKRINEYFEKGRKIKFVKGNKYFGVNILG